MYEHDCDTVQLFKNKTANRSGNDQIFSYINVTKINTRLTDS